MPTVMYAYTIIHVYTVQMNMHINQSINHSLTSVSSSGDDVTAGTSQTAHNYISGAERH